MTKVTCDDCKKACEVPFRPTAGKPVYCNDCFRGQAGGREERAPRRDFNDRPQAPRPSFSPSNEGASDLSKQISSLNVKLDRILSVMESMSPKAAVSKKEVVKSMTVSLPKKEVKKVAKKKSGKK